MDHDATHIPKSKLSSIDYVNLIAGFGLQQNGHVPNKTQMQKLLYVCYGLHLATYGEPPFTDDYPEAWLFGPVFPKAYFRYNERATPAALSDEKRREWEKDLFNLDIVYRVVKKLSRIPAKKLSAWTHRGGSPWSKVGGQGKMNIGDIKKYFGDSKWVADLNETLENQM